MARPAQHLERVPLSRGELTLELRGQPAGQADFWVLLHGLGGTRLAPLLLCLKRRLREKGAVLALPDLPGHGASGADPAELSLARGLEVLDRIDERWGRLTGRIYLAGFSYGGLIAAWWAARHADRVAGLVLGAPAFRFGDRLRQLVGKAEWDRALAAGRLEFAGPRGAVIVGGETLAEEEEFPPAALPGLVQVPTLVVHGLEDEALDWRDSLDLAQACTGPAELVLLPGAGHTFAGREEDFYRRLEAFRRSLD